jgi:hypothetical protein
MPYTEMERVELALMVFEPAEFFPKYLRTVDDVAEHRHLLEMCDYDDFAIEYLINLVLTKASDSREPNLIHALRLIQWILGNGSVNDPPPPVNIVDRLFDLYRHFVFSPHNDIRWCVSAILRGKPLQKDQIRWLIAHHEESGHLVNRLLRYPVFDPLVADWARDMLRTHQFEDRASELLGRLISQTLPPEAEQFPTETLMWAVYYSSAAHSIKQDLLQQYASNEAIRDLIIISIRLQMPTLLKKFLSWRSNQ